MFLAAIGLIAYLIASSTLPFKDKLFGLLYPKPSSHAAGNAYYVSKLGNGVDGASWASAWNELDKINWVVINPGDTIYLDGGSSEMVYNSTLTIGKSGTSTAPITVKLSSEADRNGKAIIDGGTTVWPECMPGSSGNPVSSSGGKGTRQYGVLFGSSANVILDGTKWGGIVVRNHTTTGVRFSSGSNSDTIKYLEIHNNTYTTEANGEGIWLNGTNITLSHLDIHHNGQDAIQGGQTDGLNLEYTYLHDHYCKHPDGIQIYGGARSTNFKIHHNVIKEGYLQGIFLGENVPGYGAYVDGADIHDNLIYSLEYGIKSKHESNTNWNIHHNTIASTEQFAIEWSAGGATAPMFIHDNIFYNNGYGGNGSGFSFPTVGGTTDFSNNCYYLTLMPSSYSNISGSGNVKADPQFTNSLAGDYSLPSGSPCAGKGSSITSLAQLLASNPTPTPTSFPVPTPLPTPTSAPGTYSFEAEAGILTAPYTVTAGYISQSSITTDPTLGGKAIYNFNLTQSGDYVVKVLINASSTGSNSIFLNMDSEPGTPTMIWDIPLTTSFEERTASWRGTGTESTNQFVPKIFNLSAGAHSLILRGREANAQVDKIIIEMVAPSSTPTPIPTSPSSDTIPPSVTITSPLNGAILTKNSTITISANALDNIRVGKVDFYVNNSLKCSDTISSYSCSWKLTGKVGTSYTLTAKAYDASGNISISSVKVSSK